MIENTQEKQKLAVVLWYLVRGPFMQKILITWSSFVGFKLNSFKMFTFKFKNEQNEKNNQTKISLSLNIKVKKIEK